ncbi:MAG: YgcG family protein [Rhodothermales bacterium]
MKFAFLMTTSRSVREFKRLARVHTILWALLALCYSFLGPAFLYQAGAQPAVPQLTGRVVDQASILSPETEKQVAAILASHEDSTSNQIVVLTIESLGGAVLEAYSLEVARSWQLGQGDRNNGILLLIAYADRKMRIEVGYGLEGAMPDAIAKRIIDNDLKPFFRNADFDGGVLNGVRSIVGVLEGTYEPKSSNDDLAVPLFVRLIFGLMFLGMPIFSLYATMFQAGGRKWFMLLFFMPFLLAGGSVAFPPYGGIIIAGVIFIAFIWFQWHISRSPNWQHYRDAMAKAKKTGKAVPVVIGGHTFNVGGVSRSSGGSSFGGSSFSGGGGSFGGGGASGGW